MRVVIVSKAFVVGTYQTKLEEMASHPDVDLVAVVPPSWREGRHIHHLDCQHTCGYELVTAPIALNGRYHLHSYPTLPRLLRDHRPDLVHVDEEPYNLATYLAVRAARSVGARVVVFSWQNVLTRYPLPFRLMERYVYAHTHGAIAGTPSVAHVLRAKGYTGPLAVIPQFGVDPDVFRPMPTTRQPAKTLTIGYAGRLVEQKGLGVLLRALEHLPQPWRLALAGSGPLRQDIVTWFEERGLTQRLDLREQIPSDEMPRFLNTLDVLVLPSLTRPTWKEQFGRILVEAMACEVPVIGSDSGEIPNVIGDAGLVVPEGDSGLLASALQKMHDPVLRRALGARGRRRVLARYTQSRVAGQTVAFYRQILST